MWPVIEVTDVDIVFGGKDLVALLPAYEDIPDEFKGRQSPWVRFMEDWFFRGIAKYDLTPKDGVDERKAIRHISAVMRSWAPAHEHKTAGVAYLLSQWFKDATWTYRDGEPTSTATTATRG